LHITKEANKMSNGSTIFYERQFVHTPWRNHIDRVDAEGPNGFNKKFEAIEKEFDKVSNTFSEITEELQKVTRVQKLDIDPLSITLDPDEATAPQELEVYDTGDVPRMYLATIGFLPVGTNHGQVSYHFIYEPISSTRTKVWIWFKNQIDQRTTITATLFSIAQ